MSRGRDRLRFQALPKTLRGAALAGAVGILTMAPMHADAAPPTRASATCEIAFTGRSTLHDFQGTAPAVVVALESDAEVGSSPPTSRWKGEVVIPVAGLDTDDGQRDATMRGMFEAKQWPEIRADLRNIDPAAVRESGRLPLRLTIRDHTLEVEARINDWQETPERVSFVVRMPVSLAAFGLEAPTVLGFIRVADEVSVEAHVTVVPAP